MPKQGTLLQGNDAIPLSLSLSVDEEWMQLLILERYLTMAGSNGRGGCMQQE